MTLLFGLLIFGIGGICGWFLSNYNWNQAMDRAMREYVREPE